MEMAILGLPKSGKSTLFEIMTGVKAGHAHGEEVMRGQAVVPDERFGQLVKICNPQKATPAKVSFLDAQVTGDCLWESFRRNFSGADGILHVIDGFSTPDTELCLDAYRKLQDELIFSDLLIIEKKLERLAKTSKKALTAQDMMQIDLLPRLKDCLEDGKTLSQVGLTPNEIFSLKSFSFWTIKPQLLVINIAEGNESFAENFAASAKLPCPIMSICCKIEAELSVLDDADQKEFLAALGLTEPAAGQIIRAAVSLLGRIFFFTVNENEARAWAVPVGTKALKAAGAIHHDFEKGFIKAEVMHFDDFIAYDGDTARVKSAGRLRLEGREYIVQDGDIIKFRFNV